ncbi:hypothetical protein KAW50_06210, partial [candidate division WOR-3 bacterium]|nr:hypothetical protein [candidate division WOR-3 bacterium]
MIKIGVFLHGIPYCDVSKFIRLAKKCKVADIIGICDEEHSFCDVPHEKASPYYAEWARLCKELGLYFHFPGIAPSFPLTGENIKNIKQIAGKFFLGVEIGEISTSGAGNRLKKIRNMQEARDRYVNLTREIIKKLKNKGIPTVFDVEVGPLGHGESFESGADVCFSEHASNIVLSMSSARGATKAYKKPLWGAWLNMECYGGSGGRGYPEDDSYTPAHQRRMMLDYNLSYIYGAEMICLQDCIFNISIVHNISDSTKPKYA